MGFIAEYVQQEVQAMVEPPTEGERITLLVGIDGPTAEAIPRIEAVGGAVLETLPFSTLKIELSTGTIAELEELAGVESIERDEVGRSQGRSRTRPVTIR